MLLKIKKSIFLYIIDISTTRKNMSKNKLKEIGIKEGVRFLFYKVIDYIFD